MFDADYDLSWEHFCSNSLLSAFIPMIWITFWIQGEKSLFYFVYLIKKFSIPIENGKVQLLASKECLRITGFLSGKFVRMAALGLWNGPISEQKLLAAKSNNSS